MHSIVQFVTRHKRTVSPSPRSTLILHLSPRMLFPSSALAVGVTALTLLGTSLSMPLREEAPGLRALPLSNNRRTEENGNFVLPPDFWDGEPNTANDPRPSEFPFIDHGPAYLPHTSAPPAGIDVADYTRTVAVKRQIFGCLGILCRSKPRRDLAHSAAEATHSHWLPDIDDNHAAVATRDLAPSTLVGRGVAGLGAGIRRIFCRYLELFCKPDSSKPGMALQTLNETPPRGVRDSPQHVEPPLVARAPDSASAKIWVPKPPDRFLCMLFHICKPGSEDMVQTMKDQAKKEQEAQAEKERKENEKKEEEKRKKEEAQKKKEEERPRLSKPPSGRRGVQDPRSLLKIPIDPSTGDWLGYPHLEPEGGHSSHPTPYNTVPRPDGLPEPPERPNTKR